MAKKSKKRITRKPSQNRNARVETKQLGSVARLTRTARRDDKTLRAAARTSSSNGTRFTLQKDSTILFLTGREARTLHLVLSKHYWF